jgi:hypothetical protein
MNKFNTGSDDKNTKKPPKMPPVESEFIILFSHLMMIKTILDKFNYSRYWDNWDVGFLIDSGYLILARGHEI